MRVWIFSIYNEINSTFFWLNINFLILKSEKIIIVDGGSQDGTLEILDQLAIPFKSLPLSNRGQRYNEALKYSDGEILIFVHPRTLIPSEALDQIDNLLPFQVWGALTHSFDVAHPVLEFTSWWSNFIRGDLKKIYYLDHILWARKRFVELAGGFPEECIFEDTIFCQRLLSFGLPTRLAAKATTSALRFKKNGMWRQIYLNQLCKIRFYLGLSLDHIESLYEINLHLNRSHRKNSKNQ